MKRRVKLGITVAVLLVVGVVIGVVVWWFTSNRGPPSPPAPRYPPLTPVLPPSDNVVSLMDASVSSDPNLPTNIPKKFYNILTWQMKYDWPNTPLGTAQVGPSHLVSFLKNGSVVYTISAMQYVGKDFSHAGFLTYATPICGGESMALFRLVGGQTQFFYRARAPVLNL